MNKEQDKIKRSGISKKSKSIIDNTTQQTLYKYMKKNE